MFNNKQIYSNLPGPLFRTQPHPASDPVLQFKVQPDQVLDVFFN